jgi:hypothetical protein
MPICSNRRRHMRGAERLPVDSIWKRRRGAEGMRLGSNRRLSLKGAEELPVIPTLAKGGRGDFFRVSACYTTTKI